MENTVVVEKVEVVLVKAIRKGNKNSRWLATKADGSKVTVLCSNFIDSVKEGAKLSIEVTAVTPATDAQIKSAEPKAEKPKKEKKAKAKATPVTPATENVQPAIEETVDAGSTVENTPVDVVI